VFAQYRIVSPYHCDTGIEVREKRVDYKFFVALKGQHLDDLLNSLHMKLYFLTGCDDPF
jgi:hypothetical protein